MNTGRISYAEKLLQAFLGGKDNEPIPQFSEEERQQFLVNTQANFHADQIKKIKASFKSKCTYLSHVKRINGYGIKANLMVMNHSTGKEVKRTYTLTLGVSPSEMNKADYDQIKKTLKETLDAGITG